MFLKALKIAGFSLLALGLGWIGYHVLWFSMSLGFIVALALSATFFLISGSVIGYFNPKAWYISGLMSWVGIVLVITAVRLSNIENPGYEFKLSGFLRLLSNLSLPSLIPSFIGGYAGKVIYRRRIVLSP